MWPWFLSEGAVKACRDLATLQTFYCRPNCWHWVWHWHQCECGRGEWWRGLSLRHSFQSLLGHINRNQDYINYIVRRIRFVPKWALSCCSRFCHYFVRKILTLSYKSFTWFRLFWNSFRYDNLGRFTQLCQIFFTFCLPYAGFFFNSMNFNPFVRVYPFYYSFILSKGVGGWVCKIRLKCEAEPPYITFLC